MSDLYAINNTIIYWSLWIGIAFLILSFLISGIIIVMRLLILNNNRRRENFLVKWRPLLAEGLHNVPKKLPRISKANQLNFLILWNHFHESVIGEGKKNLNEIAYKLRLKRVLDRNIESGNVSVLLLTIISLGNLGDKEYWQPLKKIISDKNITLSMAAAHALLKIDAKKAIYIVLPLIKTRKDWPKYRISKMLKEVDAEVLSEPLEKEVLRSSMEDQLFLIDYLKFAKPEKARAAARFLLERSFSDEIKAKCISVLGFFADNNDTESIKKYTDHPKWFIRLNAVIALGNMATSEDEEFFIKRLGDKEWWVRYRAAQALAGLPYMDKNGLEKIRERQTDPFAKDIMSQIIVERV